MKHLSPVKALTFDLFGTILDLGGSLTPTIESVLKSQPVSTATFWEQWRARQRIEQYQDTILSLGHSGYLTTVRRALTYTLRRNNIQPIDDLIDDLMLAWQSLSPFPEVLPALKNLADRYRLVVLSNGDPEFLDHLVQNRLMRQCTGPAFSADENLFDSIFSVETVGAFKPHTGVYLRAAASLGLEVNQCLMVSANSFDVMGARVCGMRSIFVNRYQLPYEDSDYQPDTTVSDFTQLAEYLLP